MNVIVTNAKNRIAYNIVRSLGSKGIKVYAADFVPRAMSFYSRYSSGHFLYPSPFREQEKFIECLIDKIHELKADVLIPVYEELFLVSKYKEELSKYVKMTVPDYSQVLFAHNKDRWEPFAGKLGIPVPRSMDLDDLATYPERISKLKFPLLIKPKQGGGGWGIKQLDSPGEFKDLLAGGAHEDLPWDRFIVQEKIEGEVHCVSMVFSRGVLKGKVAYRQIREYPRFGGQATCRISLSNSLAEGYLQSLLENLEWHGICQADFVVDKKTQIPYLIDMNPRFWGSLVQGIASGVDFPYLVYQIALNGDVTPVEGFKEGVTTRWLGGELRGGVPHFLEAEEKLSFLRDFLFPGKQMVLNDDFSIKDPVPFLVWGMDSLWRVVKFGNLKPHESLDGVWE